MRSVRLLTKPSYHEDEGEGSWAVSYGDMITLLLSFFVIYFTTDPVREKIDKQNTFLALELEANLSESAPFGILPESQASTLPELADISDAAMRVSQQGEKLVVSFGTTSFFSSGTTELSPKGIALLRRFTERYLPYASSYRLAIKAFTDTRPVSAKRNRRFKDNLELSALRSIAAMRQLQRSGLPLTKMELAGAGELRAMAQSLPAASALTKTELDALSRTVVLVISPEKESWP